MCMSCKDLISEKKLSNNYIMIPIGIQPWQTLTEVYHYAGGVGIDQLVTFIDMGDGGPRLSNIW